MRNFFETSFGSVELSNIQTALDEWCQKNGIAAGHPDRELAAAVMINLFREGHTTVADLSAAANRHKGLQGLSHNIILPGSVCPRPVLEGLTRFNRNARLDERVTVKDGC